MTYFVHLREQWPCDCIVKNVVVCERSRMEQWIFFFLDDPSFVSLFSTPTPDSLTHPCGTMLCDAKKYSTRGEIPGEIYEPLSGGQQACNQSRRQSVKLGTCRCIHSPSFKNPGFHYQLVRIIV